MRKILILVVCMFFVLSGECLQETNISDPSLIVTNANGGISNNVIKIDENTDVPLVYSGCNAKSKGKWQKHLTLGAGDEMSIFMYGHNDTKRDVVVGPDGRITFLQLQDFLVDGLTIEELKLKLDSKLALFYKNPKSVVIPVAFHSKKFCILGKVAYKGVYELDRPLTILEAVATACGFETGYFDRNPVELVDLPRSFLIRNQKRVKVDFNRLFLHGDLSQNVLLEPGDYLYFPSGMGNEVYVLGSVGNGGCKGLTSGTTIISALSFSGGFLQAAYKERVILVRGSLDKPEVIVVDVAGILSGSKKDVVLEPRDIVYVADHPWEKAADLADLAATAFLQTMVSVWTGNNIGPVIKHPILPSIK